MSTKPRLLTPKLAYVIDYPQAVEFAEEQNSIFWLADEIKVEKDIQDIMVNMTEAERHGVITTLKLFTLYELLAGGEYWGDRVMREFPRPDIMRMASCFAFFELNVHAPFYNKLNEALHLDTEEFYSDYVNDPILKERMEFVDSAINDENILLSLGTFSMVEGAVLYSSFAFLKHFQAEGKNLLLNVTRGINFSLADEGLHHKGGAWLYNQLKSEMELSEKETSELDKELTARAKDIYKHECRIVDMIFEKGPIEGITDVQMKHFVESRINFCLKALGIQPLFTVGYNPVSKWFYESIGSLQFHDFFVGIGKEYNRNWDEGQFTW